MPINPDAVGNTSQPLEFSWSSTDSLLYALSVGAGATDPAKHELEFTTENSANHPQAALPTQVVVLGTQNLPDFGDFDWAKLLHGEQSIELHQPLAPQGSAVAISKVAGIYDKRVAALIYIETNVANTSGEPLWTSRAGILILGEGGFGGERGPSSKMRIPNRDPDTKMSYHTRPEQALLYRLNGDRNPLHSDPSFAALAGFDQPILHGLCTFGFTGRALLHGRCEGDPKRFGSMKGRFSSPVVPGQRLDVAMWDVDDQTVFQTRVDGKVVFDSGVFVGR